MSTRDLLTASIFEVIPLKGAAEKALGLPAGANVSVTASPAKGMIATVELSEHLAGRGYTVIPHISARLTKTKGELETHVARWREAGMTKAFVVGGDADEPGEFFDALALLTAMSAIDHPFTELGITGYPEGHPTIPEDLLMTALIAKAPFASYIATQMCFDVDAIAEWIGSIRREGVTLPVFVGIPGASETVKLMTIGARIGVGASLRYLAKHRHVVGRLIRPGVFTPDRLVDQVGQLDPGLGVAGFHIFTFNQITDTVEWYRDATA